VPEMPGPLKRSSGPGILAGLRGPVACASSPVSRARFFSSSGMKRSAYTTVVPCSPLRTWPPRPSAGHPNRQGICGSPRALFGFSAMRSTGTGSFVSTHLSPGLRPPCDGGLFHNHDLPSRPIRTSGVSAGGAALPNFLRTRSVDQVGRKSETTLRIASLHFEISAFSGTATDQLKLPSGAPDARRQQWG